MLKGRKAISYPKPTDGGLRIIGTGHSFMGPGFKTLPAICKVAGFKQPMLTNRGGGQTGTASYKWEQENGIFRFDQKPKPLLLPALTTGEWDVMMWGPAWGQTPAHYACWIDFALKYNLKMKFYLSDAWPTLAWFDKNPKVEDEAYVRELLTIGAELHKRYAKLMKSLNQKYPDRVFVTPTSAAMLLAAQRQFKGELPGVDGLHKLIGRKSKSLWVDQIGHLGPGFAWLEGYVFYATIYQKSPALIKDQMPIKGKVIEKFPSEELDRIFRDIAWQAVINNELSGVTDANGNGIGDALEGKSKRKDVVH